jgi:hypothetical protein
MVDKLVSRDPHNRFQQWAPWLEPTVRQKLDQTTPIVGTHCCATMGPRITLEQQRTKVTAEGTGDETGGKKSGLNWNGCTKEQ